MKGKIFTLTIFLLSLFLIVIHQAMAEDSAFSPYAEECSATKSGRLVISPTSLEFYVNIEQNKNPEPITVVLNGFALPNCLQGIANCTTEKVRPIYCRYTTNAAGEINGTFCYEDADPFSDDPRAHTVVWPETLDFCWLAAPSDQWIVINNNTAGIAVESTSGTGSFTVTVDVNRLIGSTTKEDLIGAEQNNTVVKEGWIQVTTTIHDPSIPGDNETYMRTYTDKEIKEHVTATLSDWGASDDIPFYEQMSTWWIPVKVYINSLHEAQQEYVATTDWMDITLNVPVSDDIQGALYILAEHPGLAPGQVYAYRMVNGKPQFDLFSSWGTPVPGAENLYYTRDIQNSPLALPFSSHKDYIVTSVVPYKSVDTNTGVSDNIYPHVKAFIPVAFGGGIRMIGLEGDWIIRAVVGDPNNIKNHDSWRELLYYVLHIRPISGRWIVTEEYGGESITYIDNGVIYPLILSEERGELSGAWITPKGQTVLAVNYSNPTDGVCKQFTIQGQRVLIDSCIKKGKYDIYFTENTIWGPFEYYYRIDFFDADTGGKIEGQWQYRALGDPNWSVPERFSAVTQDVVIPLDPSCNCYYVAGKVNGIATPFIVDTGAAMVLLNLNDANMYKIPRDENGDISEEFCTKGSAVGVGGEIEGYYCPVNIEIDDGKLKLDNVWAFLSENQDYALLGMTFLKYFHVSINAKDGTMTISK